MKRIVQIRDAAFKDAYGFGFAGENSRARPKYLVWDRVGEGAGLRVYTDATLTEVNGNLAQVNVAILIESPAIRPGIYEWIRNNHELFNIVLTHQQDLVSYGKPFLFYPVGGSRIPLEQWGTHPKHHLVSLMTSAKVGTEGHRLRHEVAQLNGLDVYGAPYTEYTPKIRAMRDYRFSIVIENVQSDWYFTEKLVDCLSQGTIPIYWGCDVSKFFDMDGIVTFDTLEGLVEIIPKLTPEFYEERMEVVQKNLESAKCFRCPEDWICENHPGVLS